MPKANQKPPSIYRIHVTPRQSNGRSHIQAAHQLGITGLKACHASQLYFLYGRLTLINIQQIATNLLVDPVTEQWVVGDGLAADGQTAIEVTLHPGVTDPPAENLVRAARQMGIDGLEQAATGQHFRLSGDLSDVDLHRLANEVFANPVVQHTAVNHPIAPPFVPAQPADDTVETFPLREAGDDQLLAVSAERRLALDLAEMQAIRDYFRDEGRDPTDVELETLAQTWSEHCVHKTFRAAISYTGPDGETEEIDGLLNTYIRAATEQVNKPWVHSAFVDNAGIVAFDDHFDLAFKAETHNHPSALEPFGGANTGVGGVVRDVLGVSARPIANTDVLCFGPPDLPLDELPDGVLHPRRIADGVVAGVEDYGNKMGIPTVNGAILYDAGYTSNPLVYVGCLGILPRGSHPTEAQAGDMIVAIGGHTGRDGLRGATFSSMEMDVDTGEVAGTAVQIGHPIMEKMVQEVVLCARDERLYTAITDCGAGGFSSAVGEMGEDLGARVQLKNITLKYPGLRPWEIWLSEAQERMVLAVPPQNWPRLQEICAGQDVEAIQLGTFTGNGRLEIDYGDRRVGDMTMAFLHDGIPRRHLKAVWTGAATNDRGSGDQRSLAAGENISPAKALLKLLAHPDIRSKEGVIRQYDHEVQGGTAVKPLTGLHNHGPSDAAVLIPANQQSATNHQPPKAVALSNGIRPNYTALDPYRMAWAAVDEAFRNVTAVGADPDQVAILDNFCWGNPNLPDRLGSLVRCVQGCYDAAIAFNTPYISGKDSLNNEYTEGDGRKHAIPGTLLISAMGIVPNVNQTVTMDLKQASNLLFIIGDTGTELGGSHYKQIGGTVSQRQVPHPVKDGLNRMRALHQAIKTDLVQACHDCSEGGLAVTLAEMCLAGGLGAEIQLQNIPLSEPIAVASLQTAPPAAAETILFSETLSRFVVEIRPEDAARFQKIIADHPHAQIGRISGNRLHIANQDTTLIDLPITDLEQAWRGQSSVNSTQLLATSKQSPSPNLQSPISQSPRVLILHASGTNRDRDAALACELAGGQPEVVHVNQLLSGERRLCDYHMLVVPGGFSYGDDLGAGVLWSRDLQAGLSESMERFVVDGRPVIGICNGFQALVKAGILLGGEGNGRSVTLTFNQSSQFECRWVWLEPNPHSPSLFTAGMTEPIYCPVAHGEGRLAVSNETALTQLQSQNLIPLTYANAPSAPAQTIAYPANPNGSVLNAAALCNPTGNVLGLMPHPENHIFPWQHPRRHRGEKGGLGLGLFINGIKNA
ncbi:MAG: phosphoribosylformylglycinamidine synthase subunit PurL [Chloroflexi bacterium]|nr:phosphoribosylformylglycinamidine synthase subunit PurL [Chloroflexota bacterium]